MFRVVKKTVSTGSIEVLQSDINNEGDAFAAMYTLTETGNHGPNKGAGSPEGEDPWPCYVYVDSV
tara:strand:+ start:1617 stop:1811 length:195 start_codon:yes stop_codon:yes gene_type:complete